MIVNIRKNIKEFEKNNAQYIFYYKAICDIYIYMYHKNKMFEMYQQFSDVSNQIVVYNVFKAKYYFINSNNK